MFSTRNIKRNGRASPGNFVFRRKKRTLQVEMKHRLDLNPETDATRRQKRLHTAGLGAKIAAGFLFVMGLFSLCRIVVNEAFVDSERFQLQHISVKTDGDLSSAQIIAASGLETGVNTLGISLVKVRESLESLPEVQSARVSRGYPGIVFLDIQQRRPVAWLECAELRLEAKVAGYGCLLDAEGCVLQSGDITSAERKLPVIKVGKLDRILPGQRIESPEVHSALRLLHAHEVCKTEPALKPLRMEVGSGFAVTAIYESRLQVIFPTHQMERQMQRLSQVLAEAGRQKWQLATVNLQVEHNVPVTFQSGNRLAAVNSSRHREAGGSRSLESLTSALLSHGPQHHLRRTRDRHLENLCCRG